MCSKNYTINPNYYFDVKNKGAVSVITTGQPGHIDQIKQTNAGAVYRLIDLHGPISRIELSKLTQLAPASITKIVRELLEAHLIKETEYQDPGSRGRPAIGLTVDTDAWHYLAVRISPGQMDVALRDLSSKIVSEDVVPLPNLPDSPLLPRILQGINQFFISNQHKLERLTAIAITLPGIIDVAKGIVHRMPFYDVNEMPLGEELYKLTGLPVYMQHDIGAWTLAEALFGASRGCQNVIQIVIDHNVGAGVITSGQVLHSRTQSVVEIGHTQVDPYGKRCYCGNNGCLETVVSTENLLELTRLRLKSSMGSLLNQSPLTVESICQAALQEDLLAKDIIAGIGENVGRIAAIMVNVFNPEKILVGSPFNHAAQILHPVIKNCIQQQAIPTYSEHVLVESTRFDNTGTISCAALIKEAMYTGSLLVQLLQG